MAATTIGTVPTFDPVSSSFEEWTEILEEWCVANDVTEDKKKRAVLLTNLGAKAYHTLRALMQPDKPNTKSYKICKSTLQEHFSPAPSEIVLRYRFHVRGQKPGESISDFVAQLRHLSDGCNFDDLSKALRDRLVVGCQNPAIQRRLLSEKDLTFEKALSTATAMEMASKDVEDIQKMAHPDSKVNKLHFKYHGRRGQQQQQPPRKSAQTKCWRCGGAHDPTSCSFKNSQCYKCKYTGHTKSQCEAVQQFLKRRKQKKQGTYHLVESDTDDDEEELSHLEVVEPATLNRLSRSQPYEVNLYLNDVPVSMELDTGSPWSILSSATHSKLGQASQLEQTDVRLRTYNGTPVSIQGQAQVRVQLGEGEPPKSLTVLVVSKGVDLLGRDWIEELPLALAQYGRQPTEGEMPPEQVASLQASQLTVAKVLENNTELFEDTVHGRLTTCKAKMYPAGEDRRIFYKAAPVAYATKPKVDEHLDRMLEQNIIEEVRFSEYACPIVIADKPNGDIRICGNYKLTANKVLNLEQYPIPSLEDMVQSLQGGQFFSKVDLSHAYNQVELDDDSKKYTTINTHRGLYQYNRLPYGIASAPAWFQRTMETLLSGIPMCRPYLDDVIISGRTEQEHLENLQAVLQRLRESGMKLKREKCEFMKTSMTYLGHQIDAKGIYPLDDKLEAISAAPEPRNQEELRAYLGLLGYYRQFIPNLTKHIAPLNQLLKAEFSSKPQGKGRRGRRKKDSEHRSPPDPKFTWGPEQKEAFQASKKLLKKGQLLVHYDVEKPLLLQTDASQYGLGAVISHVMPDGTERPISFASRTMTEPEKNYAQYEKEGLSIIFGLKKFHKFLHGRTFTIVTDHQPLVHLFGDQKPTSPMASARVTRWHITLSGYKYKIVHKKGNEHLNADALSRLPLPCTDSEMNNLDETQEPVSIHLLSELDTQPVTAEEVKRETSKDPVLSRVREYILRGWPEKSNIDPDLQAYYCRRDELSVDDDIILWGRRVVIPQASEIRTQLMSELHATHPGIVKMKALARSYFWWPKLDAELELVVRTCPECQEHQKSPTPVPMHPWEFPEKPWQRIHIDYATVEGKEVLIGVDAHSKWIEATIMTSTTAAATVKELRRWFARYGLPETVVSDNGPQFVAEDFFAFLTENGVRHVQTAPYHPSSNGLAERAVQTVKTGIIKMSGDLEVRLQKLLMRYRLTPQATTGCAPSELMLKRRIRSKLDQIRPDINRKVRAKQAKMKESHTSKERNLGPDESVLVKNFGPGPTHLYGVIRSKIGPTMLEVQLEDGKLVRRHMDHVRKCLARPTHQADANSETPSNTPLNLEVITPTVEPNIPVTPLAPTDPKTNHSLPAKPGSGPTRKVTAGVVAVRRESDRVRQEPAKFKDFVKY